MLDMDREYSGEREWMNETSNNKWPQHLMQFANDMVKNETANLKPANQKAKTNLVFVINGVFCELVTKFCNALQHQPTAQNYITI